MKAKNQSNLTVLSVAAAALLGIAGFLQTRIDPLRRQKAIEPPSVNKVLGGLKGAVLPFEYTLGAVSGFRQIVAGLLWVRADSFFHGGNYDAILPMIRLITWLDPNWLDPYATGAWHLTYNFTDTDQRSDRRYLPAGVALLNEGIQNNPTIYDMYKEKGWLYFDKFKDFKSSAEAYADGMKTENADITQVGHALAHCYERLGEPEKAKEVWQRNVALHQAILDDPKADNDRKGRATQGIKNATKNLEMVGVREVARKTDINPPVEVDFRFRVKRVKPKVLEVAGTWHLFGAKSFDYPNKTIGYAGPVDGARVVTRLQDAGYTVPKEEDVKEFSFEVDPDLTIMQDILSTRGGKKVEKGGIYILNQTAMASVEPAAEKAGVYPFNEAEAKGLGVPLDQALARNLPISPLGLQQLASIADPLPFSTVQPMRTLAESRGIVARLKSDGELRKKLVDKGLYVAVKDMLLPGEYRREIDMSKDPKMYSFNAEKYELILMVHPSHTPDFVRDRIGWKGEGWTDDRYIQVDEETGARMIRVVIPLTKEDITGEGEKLLVESDAGVKLPSEVYKAVIPRPAAVPAKPAEGARKKPAMMPIPQQPTAPANN